jgi:tetratricopeptide (TPR) repeat protein
MNKKASPSGRRSEKALELFEKAMRAMGKKDFERAAAAFEALLTEHPDERDMAERARAFQVVCDRALEKKGVYKPKGFEDLLQYGVFLHNQGDFGQAQRYLRDALEIHPKNDHAQYCLAASAARAGETETALSALRSAIAANAQTRAQARVDSDFDVLRDDDAFQELLYPPLS